MLKCIVLFINSKSRICFPSVTFSIKSFKFQVPELYIDVPETASVGSLKVCVYLFPRHVIMQHVVPFDACAE